MGVDVKELDYKTLEFCKHLLWQGEFMSDVGRDNAEKRARKRVYIQEQEIISHYMQMVKEAIGQSE